MDKRTTKYTLGNAVLSLCVLSQSLVLGCDRQEQANEDEAPESASCCMPSAAQRSSIFDSLGPDGVQRIVENCLTSIVKSYFPGGVPKEFPTPMPLDPTDPMFQDCDFGNTGVGDCKVYRDGTVRCSSFNPEGATDPDENTGSTGGKNPDSTDDNSDGGNGSTNDSLGDTSDDDGMPDDSNQDDPEIPDDDTGTDGSGQDLSFFFHLSGTDTLVSARILGGKAGSEIIVDRYPESLVFDIEHGDLPMGYPDEMNRSFCESIAEDVGIVEKGGKLGGVQRENLRSYPSVMLNIPFATLITSELKRQAIKAAKLAGATSSALTIGNPPSFEQVDLSVDFSSDSLTKRMGDSDQIIQDLNQDLHLALKKSAFQGAFVSGTSWPDFMCDLYTRAATLSIDLQEDGWSATSSSQELVPFP